MKPLIIACMALMAMSTSAQTGTAEWIKSPPVSDTIACEMLVSLRESGSRAFYMTGFIVTTTATWSSSVSEYLYPNKKPLPKEIKVWLCTYEPRYKPL